MEKGTMEEQFASIMEWDGYKRIEERRIKQE